MEIRVSPGCTLWRCTVFGAVGCKSLLALGLEVDGCAGQGARGHGQMHVNDAAATQAVSPEVIPTADHGRGQTEIVGYRLDRVSPAYLVAGRVPGVAGIVFRGRMLARRDRDNQLAVRFELIAGHEMVLFFDGRRGGAVGTGNRGQR